MMLVAAFNVHESFCFHVSSVGAFWRAKRPKVFGYAICSNARTETTPMLSDAEKTTRPVRAWASKVLLVYGRIGLTKISDRIVFPVAVNVVQKLHRPKPMNVKPRKTVRKIFTPANMNADVPAGHLPADFLPCFPPSRAVNRSKKFTAQCVVSDEAKKSLVRQSASIQIAHAFVPIKRCVGSEASDLTVRGFAHFTPLSYARGVLS